MWLVVLGNSPDEDHSSKLISSVPAEVVVGTAVAVAGMVEVVRIAAAAAVADKIVGAGFATDLRALLIAAAVLAEHQ